MKLGSVEGSTTSGRFIQASKTVAGIAIESPITSAAGFAPASMVKKIAAANARKRMEKTPIQIFVF